MTTNSNPLPPSCSTANGHVHGQRNAASHYSTYLPPTTATHPASRAAGSQSRKTKRQHRFRSRARTRRNTSSDHTYTTSPFSCRVHTNQHQSSSPPRGTANRGRFILSTLRWRVHLVKFSFLLQFDRLRTWLVTKTRAHKFTGCLKTHFLRKKPERRQHMFPRGPGSYEAVQQQQQAATATTGGRNGEGEEKRGRIRRLSQSTVRSLKKACNLNSERDELREADRRAMERLDELWRTNEL